MANENSQAANAVSAENAITATENKGPSNLSIESLILLITRQRLDNLNNNTKKEFQELKDRQKKVADLHKIQKSINKATSTDGTLDLKKNDELKQLLQSAKEHGIEVKDDKTSYNKEERNRLMDNIRMTVEDLNVQNDMQLQQVSRYTNERYETYQMARSILKPLHDDKHNKARAIAGR
jgi:hypothetical protein